MILNSDYPEFLCWLYSKYPGLENRSYDEQMQIRAESLFGVADFYSSNLCKLGHKAWDIHANNEFIQRAWARERGVHVESVQIKHSLRGLVQRRYRTGKKLVRFMKSRFFRKHVPQEHDRWFHQILSAQIKHCEPDVLLNQAMDCISSQFLKEIKKHTRLLVGQIAAPLPQSEDFQCYDLVISSLPNLVNHFRMMRISSELSRLAFEPRVLRMLPEGEKQTLPVSFVGSFFPVHKARVRLLEYLCEHLPMKVWGQGIESLSSDSPIRKCYVGKAWGIEMYSILHRSKITMNHHIDVAESYANNMRLYEATGVGTLLITDWKENLHEIFDPEKEVVAYRTPEECVEQIQYYLEHDTEREKTACAGQQRTLAEHTYHKRMQELINTIQKYL